MRRNYFISTEMCNKPCFNENTGTEVKDFIIETLSQSFLYNVLAYTCRKIHRKFVKLKTF